MTTTTQTLDAAMESIVRRVVKEELRAELSAPAAPQVDLYPLGMVVKKLRISKRTLKRLRKEGSLVPDMGEGRLARYSVATVKDALALHARSSGAPRAKALSILSRRRSP